MNYKTCHYCKYFERNPKSKYYSHCLRDKDNIFEIQAEYAQYCHRFEARNSKVMEIISHEAPA